jgi:hypothetical protein
MRTERWTPTIVVLAILLGTASLAAQPAEAPPPSPAPDINLEQIERAIVECDTLWSNGFGLLVGDDRTVIMTAPMNDAGRGITIRGVNGGGETEADQVDVATPWSADQRILILTLAGTTGGTPLVPTARDAALGDRVRVLDKLADLGSWRFELVETTISAVSETRLSLGAGDAHGYDGAPALDEEGRLLGIMDSAGNVLRIERILSPGERLPRAASPLPLFGLYGFYEWGGLADGSGGVRLRYGVTLWDQLSILMYVGFNSGGDERTMRLDPVDGSGPGMVAVSDLGLDAGFDFEYRLLLARSTMPLYARFVVGLRYSFMSADPAGLPLWSSSPSCDPLEESCSLRSGPAVETVNTHAVGLEVGADLTWGGVTVGYRFVPADVAYHLPNTHTLVFGVSMF